MPLPRPRSAWEGSSAGFLFFGIVLDSLSERQRKQGLDWEFWGKELVEKGDDLSGTCGGEDFAERVQAESEQRPGAAAMFLDGNGMQARHGDAGFDGERHGESQEREQGAQFVRVGEVRGLQGEAFGLEIAEHGFDGPALAIAGERMTRAAGTGQGQEFA